MGTPPMKILFGTKPPKFLAAWAAIFITGFFPPAADAALALLGEYPPAAPTDPGAEPRDAGGNLAEATEADGEAAEAVRGLPHALVDDSAGAFAVDPVEADTAEAGGMAVGRLPEAVGPTGADLTI
mmetsp:Transcript_125594/g.316576  ORF Transcript_125594/g.316576 Transcript_125594/m.316576 type:complete len:126 (+) Transcript_125594:682-1059(+)